jgi:hypothetical protein
MRVISISDNIKYKSLPNFYLVINQPKLTLLVILLVPYPSSSFEINNMNHIYINLIVPEAVRLISNN